MAIAAVGSLSTSDSSLAQQPRPEPPLRQPMLIHRIPEPAKGPVLPRAPSRPAPTERSASPLPDQDLFYDPDGPAFARLQKANEALAGFPVDRSGLVDWNALLARGRITPRASLDGNGAMAPYDLDVVLRNTKEMPWVRFPHLAHSQWLDCASCHPAPFAAKAGAAVITMERIFRGEACGMCHGKVAFSAWQQCERCHSVARPGTKALYAPPADP